MTPALNRWIPLCNGQLRWLAVLLYYSGLQCSLLANPADPSVLSGQAQFQEAGALLEITTSDQVLIEWGSFSIAQGETTQFIQPGTTSLAINRVTGVDPSAFYGTLAANGRVMVINPNGILVGSGGVIDTGGFIASTLDIPNDQLLGSGDWLFKGDSQASVINRGTIAAHSGDVLLIAREVENAGSISSGGLVGLAGGQEVLVARQSDAILGFYVRPQAGAGTVNQAGQIQAIRAELEAAGGNPYALAINHGGVTRAVGYDKSGGRVRLLGHEGLVQVQGEIEAVVETPDEIFGGGITILASEVKLMSQSKLLATGDMSGGTILIDGKKSLIFEGLADAGSETEGSGGTIDFLTSTLFARGTALSSSGGMITFDPNVLVVNATGTGGAPGTSYLSTGTIVSAMDSGAGSIVEAGSSITLDDSIVTTGGNSNSLIFQDENGNDNVVLTLNAGITLGATQTLTLDADVVLGAGVSIEAPSISFLDTLDAAGFNLGLITDSLSFADSVSGTGSTLTIENQTANTSIGIDGGAGTLSLSLAQLSDGFSGITIGSSDAGTITLAATTFLDPVTLIGSGELVGANQATTYTVDGAGEGSITGFAETVTFQGITKITPGNANDTFTFADGTIGEIDLSAGGSNEFDYSGQSGNVQVDLGNGSATGITTITSFSNLVSLVGNGTNTELVLSSSGSTVTIDTAGGGDVDTTFDFTSIGKLTGGTMDDTFVFADGTIGEIDLSAGGSNEFDYTNQSGTVAVDLGTPAATGVTTLTGVANLTSIIGEGTDTTLTFGGGDDDVVLTAIDAGGNGTVSFDGVTAINGGGGSNSLELDTARTVTIDGAGSGDVSSTLDWDNFAKLIASGSGDTFAFADGTIGEIDLSAGGSNEFDYSGQSGNVQVDLGSGSATGITTITSFSNLVSLVGNGTNTELVLSSSTGSTVTIDTAGGGDVDTTFDFTSIGKLTGGTMDDTFVFADGTIGEIDLSAGGSNEFDYTNQSGTVAVDLGTPAATGVATLTGVANLTSIIGEGTDTTLTFGGGDDDVVLTAIDAGGNGSVTFDDVTAINGGGGTNSLELDTARTVTIDGAGSGDVSSTLDWDNFAKLITSGSGDTFAFADGTIGEIDLSAGGSNEFDYTAQSGTVAVDLGTPSATGVVTLTGVTNLTSVTGNGANSTLTLTNGVDEVVINGSDDGTVGGTFSFTDFANIDGIDGADTFSFSGADGALSGDLDTGDGAASISFANDARDISTNDFIGGTLTIGGTLSIDYSNQTTEAITVDLGTGSATGISVFATGDIANLTSLTGNNSDTTLSFAPGDADVVLTGINAGGNGTVTFDGVTAINGGGGSNSLELDVARTVNIDGANSGDIDSTLDWDNFAKLIASGSGATFAFADGTIGEIDLSAGGSNEFDYSSQSGTVAVDLGTPAATGVATLTGVANLTSIIGEGTDTTLTFGGGDDDVVLTAIDAGGNGSVTFDDVTAINGGAGTNSLELDTARTVTIDGAGSGDVSSTLDWDNFAKLIASGSGDTFAFADGTIGEIDLSAGGSNEFDYSGQSGNVQVDLGNGSATGITTITSFSNLVSLVGNGANTELVLSSSSGSTVTIDTAGGGDVDTTFDFASIGKLTGGTMDDTFVFADGTIGEIDLSAGGSNEFDYSAQSSAVAVDLGTPAATGVATLTGVANLTSIIGEGTDTTLTFGGGDDDVVLTGINAGGNGTVTFDGVTAINGGGGSNSLELDTARTVTIDGVASGDIDSTLDWDNFAKLIASGSGDTFTFADGTIGEIDLSAGGSNEFDYSGQSGNVQVDLGNGSATGITTITSFSNLVSLVGNGTNTELVLSSSSGSTVTIDTAGGGDVDTTFDFTSIGKLTGGTMDDTFVFADGTIGEIDLSAGGSNEFDYSSQSGTVVVNVGAPSATGVSVLNGIANLTDILGNANDTTVTFGAGNDDVVLTAIDAGGNGSVTFDDVTAINGGGGSNSLTGPNAVTAWTLSSIGTGTVGATDFGSFATINGGTDIDTLTGPDSAILWNITGADSGNVLTTVFTEMENLTGGSDDDTFAFGTAGTLSGILLGGGEDTGDVINLSTDPDVVTITGSGSVTDGANNVLNSFDEIESIDGGTTSANTLINGTGAAAIFDITGNNSGNLTEADTTRIIAFSNFANLTGGNNLIDTFDFSDGFGVSGTINGGSGSVEDILDYEDYSTAVVVNLSTGAGTNIGGGFSGIEAVTGGSASDTFTASNTISNSFTGNGGGDTYNITYGSSSITTTITEASGGPPATDTVNLTGSASDDTFTLATATTLSNGSHAVAYGANVEDVNLNGLGQTTGDTLVAFNQTNSFNVTGSDAGDLGVIDFISIENITGGNATDTYTFGGLGQLTGTLTDTSGTSNFGGTYVLGRLDISGDSSLSADTLFDSSSANGTVALGALDGNGNRLTVNTGLGTKTFNGAITDLTNDPAFGAITLLGTGAATFHSTVTSNEGGIQATGLTPVRFNGDVTLGNDSVGSTFNGLVTINNSTYSGFDNLNFNGGITFIGNAEINSNGSNLSVGQLTGGTQVHLNAGTTGTVNATNPANNIGALQVTANIVNYTENGPITQFAPWTIQGTATIDSVGNAITLTNGGNRFGGLSLRGGTVSVAEADATDLAFAEATTLNVDSGGDIAQTGRMDVGTLSGSANGSVTLTDPANEILQLGDFSRNGTFDLYTLTTLLISGLVNQGGLQDELTIISDDSMTLSSNSRIGANNDANITLVVLANSFTNNSGSTVNLTTTGLGIFLIYAPAIGQVQMGALDSVLNFRQFDTAYPSPPLAPGNGLLLNQAAPPELNDTPLILIPYVPPSPIAVDVVLTELNNTLIDLNFEEVIGSGSLGGDLNVLQLGGSGDVQFSEQMLQQLLEDLNPEARQELVDAMQALLGTGIDVRETDLPEGLVLVENGQGYSVVVSFSQLMNALMELLSEEEKKRMEELLNSAL
jgi:filamentous hemagglutinin family protein